MSDSENDSEQPVADPSGDGRDHDAPVPFWRKPVFAAIAALIALIGTVWRCA